MLTGIIVFEDDSLADKATGAVEKTIHHEGDEGKIGEPGIEPIRVEEKTTGNI